MISLFHLLSGLLSAGGMGLWHGVEHYEKMKIADESDVELFVKAWPTLLQENTEFRYDWSYIVSWIGVGMTLASAILFSLAAMCIKNDKEREEAMNMQYLMPGKIFKKIIMEFYFTQKIMIFSVPPKRIWTFALWICCLPWTCRLLRIAIWSPLQPILKYLAQKITNQPTKSSPKLFTQSSFSKILLFLCNLWLPTLEAQDMMTFFSIFLTKPEIIDSL